MYGKHDAQISQRSTSTHKLPINITLGSHRPDKTIDGISIHALLFLPEFD
jgi:hypothetical protein